MAAQNSKFIMSDKFSRSSSAAANARRAELNVKKSGSYNFTGGKELINDLESKKVGLDEIKDSELPEKLRKLSIGERAKFVEEASKKRKEISKKIVELSKKRQEYLREKSKTLKDGGKGSLDYKIWDAIRTQAKSEGLEYNKGPAY